MTLFSNASFFAVPNTMTHIQMIPFSDDSKTDGFGMTLNSVFE